VFFKHQDYLLPIMKLPPTPAAATTTPPTPPPTTMETNTPSSFSINKSNLYEFLSLLEDPESLFIQLLDKETNPQLVTTNTATTTTTNDSLRRVCQTLFSQIESYHQCWLQLKQKRRKKKNNNNNTITTIPTSLADIDSLWIGHDTLQMDAETIWGQIDLQNQALFRSLQRQLLKLESTTNANTTIQLVDWNKIQPEQQEEENDDDDDDDASDPSSTHETNDDDNDDDDTAEVDSQTQRIRNRMKRIRDEMSDDDDDDNDDDDDDNNDDDSNNNDEDQHPTSSKDNNNDEEDVVDPVRETLMDGFFDLHEMEAFADEEEEYHLPEQQNQNDERQKENTKEQRTFKTKALKSFHQRQRDGDLELEYSEDDDEDDDDSDDDDRRGDKDKSFQTNLQQKQYRPQDEVDALFQIYEEPNDDDDDDEDDPAIHMTAADFFGLPNPNLLKKYHKSSNKFNSKDKQNSNFATHDNDNNDDDDDSWDHHNFDDAKDWRTEEKGSDEDEDNDDDEDVEITTTPNREDTKKQSRNLSQSERLHKQTQDLELDMLAEKPWHMMGESKSTSRPVNSLLDNTPEFQTAMKAAPILTVEHSQSLEEIIRKRILSEQYDNVLPRELPDVGWNAKRGELPEVSQEKSKLGLGELYEREYLQKALGYDRTASERETEESKIQMELKGLFASLCNKLDALSHYHFCPRPIEPDTDIRPVATAPAIAMEETLPLFVSQARGVAPEEIYHHGIKSGVIRGDTEDPEYRRKLRNRNKVARRKAKKAKLADEKLVSRLVPYTSTGSNNNPYERRKLQEELQMARGKGQVRSGVEETASSNTISKYTKSRSLFQHLESERTTSLQPPKESDSSLLQRSSSTKSSHSYKL
jgi:U3 small nucleolar RNA-associated protein MPP10